MKKLNPNSNNNHYVQMKQSQVKESSYGSQNSDVLSLTSNNSDIIVNKSENQVEEFKQKMSHLLGTRVYESLDDLYSKIKEKVGSKLIKQTSKQLSGMETALGRVKKNNRQMAKLVTVLGTKEEKSHQKQKINKARKKQNCQQASLKFSKVNSEQSSQFYNYHCKKRGHQSSNSLSAGSSFLKDRKQRRKEDSKLDESENDRIRYMKPKVRETFEEQYKWKNRIYEQKVRQMLMELGNIKKELNISHNLPSKFNSDNEHRDENRKLSKKTRTGSEKIRSSIDTRLNAKQSQDQQQQSTNQLQSLQINSAFNPKIVVSEQISSEEITVDNKEEKQSKKQIQTKATTNKVSTDTSNAESNGISIKKNVKEGNYGQGNYLLIEKAKGISKMLQEIKAQLTQTTARSPLPSILEQGQRTNIQLLGSHNFLSELSNQQLFKREQLTKQQRQILSQINDQNESTRKDYQLQQNKKLQKLQENTPLQKHIQSSRKNSVFDNMNNSQSKIIFADKRIQQHGLFQPQRSYNRIQTPSFTFIPQHQSSISKQNITNSRPNSNTKPYIMTYPSLGPSNSFSTLPHYTSSNINNNRPPINKRPSSHLNNHVSFASNVRSYETSHVAPVTKFSKQQVIENKPLIRTPSFHRMAHQPLIVPYPQSQNAPFLKDRSRSIVRIGRSFSEKKLSNESLTIPHQNFPPQIIIPPGIIASKMKEINKADPYIVTLGSSLKKPKRRSISVGSKDRSRSKGIDVYSSKQKL